MPKSVCVAIACVVLATSSHAMNLISSLIVMENIRLKPIIHVTVGVLLVWGIIRGEYQAWKWGRILSGIAACLALLMSVFIFPMAFGVPGAGVLVLMWCAYVLSVIVMYFALGTESAKAYFGIGSGFWDRYNAPSPVDELQGHMANGSTTPEPSEMLEVECPHCGAALKVTEEAVGKTIACPICDGDIELEGE